MKNMFGAGLLDVLIALLILGASIAVLMNFEANLIRDRGLAQQRNEALILAQDKMNNLRYFEVITTQAGFKAYDDLVSGSQTVSGSHASYNLNWTVTTNDTPPHKVVQVTISWVDSKNTTQQLQLESVVGRIDPLRTGLVSQGL